MAFTMNAVRSQFRKAFKVHTLFVDAGVPKGGTPKLPPLVIQPTEPPTDAIEGSIYFDDDTHKLMIHTGSGWETVTSS